MISFLILGKWRVIVNQRVVHAHVVPVQDCVCRCLISIRKTFYEGTIVRLGEEIMKAVSFSCNESTNSLT